MSANSEFLASFQMLSDSMRNLAGGVATKKAQNKVDEINADDSLNEFQKIKAQQQVANQAAQSMAVAGISSDRIASAKASLAPDIPDARMAQLEATGKGSIAEAQSYLLSEQEKKAAEKEKRDFDRDMQKIRLTKALDKENDLSKLQLKGTAKPIPPAISNKLGELMDMRGQMVNLIENADKNSAAIGPLDQYRPNFTLNSEEVSYRKQTSDFFNQYRKLITGAAASMPELKGLLKAIPTESDYQGDFKVAMQKQLEGVDRAVANRIKLLKAQGRDTSDLEELFNIDMGAAGPTAPGQKTIAVPQSQGGAPAQGMSMNIPGLTLKPKN